MLQSVLHDQGSKLGAVMRTSAESETLPWCSSELDKLGSKYHTTRLDSGIQDAAMTWTGAGSVSDRQKWSLSLSLSLTNMRDRIVFLTNERA